MSPNQRNLPTRPGAIKLLLNAWTHQDLAALYNPDMEVQVNVARDNGQKTESGYKGKGWMTWTDGDQTWFPFRIPKNAATEPTYEEKYMTYSLSDHAEGIGMTGWDWKNRLSRWVAFDFDAIAGHSDVHGKKCSEDDLRKIQDLVSQIPWVTVRKSTSGSGLHLYVFLNGVETANHNEHAALARAILGIMSGVVGFDFSAKVDVCGGNMWVWHRKMQGTPGLELIKQGCTLESVPPNWKEHVKVVSGSARKTKPNQITDEKEEDLFDSLTTQRAEVKLDSEHRKLFEQLSTQGALWSWDADRRMLVTHTYELKLAHDALKMRGSFETIAEGKERGQDINCFCFPMRNGSWTVRRFSRGVAEHSSWTQDGQGWSRAYLNKDPDFETAAKTKGGQPDTGGFYFAKSPAAVSALESLGATDTELPHKFDQRHATLKKTRNGNQIQICIPKDRKDDDSYDGWIPKNKEWRKIIEIPDPGPVEPEIGNHDEVVRHMITHQDSDAGWVINANGKWNTEPQSNIALALKGLGYPTKDAQVLQGRAVLEPWMLVNEPFQPEYPGGRTWNRSSARLKFTPSFGKDDLEYPTWQSVLDHVGASLDAAVGNNAWCKNNHILTGADYLKCWIASLFQYPKEPLPYLFLYGEQNIGKSSLHEALQILITESGVVRADNALTSGVGFNGELAGAVLCVIEEMDLRKKNAQVANSRIKDWTTARTLQIHQKHRTPFTVVNTSHWIQVANDRNYCPVFPGDTRMVFIEVKALPKDKIVPKRELIERLTSEASDFLAAVLTLEIPKSPDRLNIPVIETNQKSAAQESNLSPVETFIVDELRECMGSTILFSVVYDRYKAWMEENFMSDQCLGKVHFRQDISAKLVTGVSVDGNRYIANCKLKGSDVKPTEAISAKNGRLYVGDEEI